MKETCNNCFGLKIHSPTLHQVKAVKYECRVAVIFRHSCLPVFVWRRVVRHIFDPKQLLQVSCILWYYYSKCYSIILENASLLVLHYYIATLIPTNRKRLDGFNVETRRMLKNPVFHGVSHFLVTSKSLTFKRFF